MTFDLAVGFSCLDCLWGTVVDEDGLIECRRYPPEIFVVDGKPVQYRPRMSPTNLCGEHTSPEDI